MIDELLYCEVYLVLVFTAILGSLLSLDLEEGTSESTDEASLVICDNVSIVVLDQARLEVS